MTQIIKAKVDKINTEPSVSEMKAFGMEFSKKEWSELTRYGLFLHLVDKDICQARDFAKKVLNKV